MSERTVTVGGADEDVLELPRGWRHRVHPRRGGSLVPRPTVDETAVDEIAELLRKPDLGRRFREMPKASGSEPDAVDAVRRHLDGRPDVLGAAVIASVVLTDRRYTRGQGRSARRLVDSWIAGHGLTFAARALAELARISTHHQYQGSAGQPVDVVTYLRPGQYHDHLAFARDAARAVRTLLAVTGDDDYEDAVKHLADHRVHPLSQVMASYLVPDRHDWVDECLATLARTGFKGSWALWCAVDTTRHLGLVAAQSPLTPKEAELDIIATLVDAVGPAATPQLAVALDRRFHARQSKLILQALGTLPTDEAFQALLDRLDQQYVQAAVEAAAKRFPVRALRLLAGTASGTSKKTEAAGDLLRAHVLANPGIVSDVLPDFPAGIRATIESVTAAAPAGAPGAPMEALPPVLASPPWTGPGKRAKPVVVTGLVPPDLRSLLWAPGEREQWADTGPGRWRGADWNDAIRRWESGELEEYDQARLLISAPEDLVRPLVGRWWSDRKRSRLWVATALAGRFGLDALPVVLRAAEADAPKAGGLLLPFLAHEVAVLQASWFKRLKTAREHAVAWFDRHGLEAAMMLVPDAVGKAGTARVNAEAALRHLAARHGDGAVVEVAARYGEDAARAVTVMLSTDPLEMVPTRVPKLPEWADPRVLPPVLLRGGEHALPVDAVGHLLTMLAMSPPEEPYAGIAIVRDACDRASLAEFSWALFQRWEALGAPSKDNWAFTQLGLIGDDGTVERLVPLIRAWPSQGNYGRAVRSLDVLAAMGSDAALFSLYDFSQKAKTAGFRTKARQKIDQVATAKELGPEQLADRLVPRFDLDERGSMVLDYGPRRFTVGFDEQLKPYVLDENGARRKALPRPGAEDDETLAPDAYKRFGRLKRDVRTVASDQIKRLEHAMTWGRRWSLSEFQRLFLQHPLLWHIVRRLIWVAETKDGAVAFRIAEDRTFADADDETATIPDTARIGIPHPIELGERQLAAWSEIFADYEILQPFQQLGRPVHVLGPGERATDRLARFEKAKSTLGKVFGLKNRGWRFSQPEDRHQARLTREIVPGRYVNLGISPGIYGGDVGMQAEQSIDGLDMSTDPDGSRTRTLAVIEPITFNALPPAAISELLSDLTDLTG